MKSSRGWAIGAIAIGVIASAWGKDEPIIVPPFKEIEALPIVREVAEREKVPLGRIMASNDRLPFQPGDSVTALVSLTKGGALSQWLVHLTCTELSGEELKRPPPPVRHMYTSTGTELVFGGKLSAIAIRVLGPYQKSEDSVSARKGAKDLKARALVDSESLSLGFDRSCETIILIEKQAHESVAKDKPFSWGMADHPFPADGAKASRTLMEKLGLTVEGERALAGAGPALGEFWQLAGRTPGLQELVRAVVDIPWIAIAMKGGQVIGNVGIDFSNISSDVLLNGEGRPDRRAYAFPVTVKLNDKPALACNILVTGARPPLVTCAGIIAMAAQAPNGKGPHLMIQIVDARSAGVDPGDPGRQDEVLRLPTQMKNVRTANSKAD